MNRFPHLAAAAIVAPLSVSLACAVAPIAHAAPPLSAGVQMMWQQTPPAGVAAGDRARFTAESAPITVAQVGQTVKVGVTTSTGATPDAATLHLHYGQGSVWTPITSQPVAMSGAGHTRELSTTITRAMVGRQVQAYGDLAVSDLTVPTVQVTSAVSIGHTSDTFTGRVTNPSPLGQRTPLMWVHMGGSDPSDAQLRQVAGHYDTVVLGAYMTGVAAKLRTLDPGITILAYLDLASARSFDASQAISSGVSYTAAQRNGWLARDTSGQLVQWHGYPGQYQTTVWDAGYQKAWTAKAVQLATSGPWSGIFADNDMASLRYYDAIPLAGTSSQTASDAKLTAGLGQLVQQAGAALQNAGRLFVPNIGESRLHPATWQQHSRFGGGFEEMWMAWDAEHKPTVWNWGDGGWSSLERNVDTNTAGYNLACTQASAGDTRTLLYGYASFLLTAHPGDTWGANTGEVLPVLPAETALRLGLAVGPMTPVAAGGWSRTFQHGWVAVNPSATATLTVPVPAGARRADGQLAGPTVTLGPMQGTVLTR